MATGSEHYQRAEALLERAEDQDIEYAAYTVAVAQVHATLALAAATALPWAGDMPVQDCDAWRDVAGTKPSESTEADAPAAYPEPGSEIPGQPGYVVGKCGHRVAASEWRSGFRVCERCPYPDTTGARGTASDSSQPAGAATAADVIHHAAQILRTPATAVEDQAVRLERLAEAAPLLAALLEQVATHNHCASCGEHDPSLHEDPAYAAARALMGGAS